MYIAKDILKSNPKCSAEDVKHLVELGRRYAGSGQAKVLDPMKHFMGLYKKPNRSVSTTHLASMVSVKQSGTAMTPLLMTSILMMLASSETSGSLKSADIKTVFKHKDVQQCESIISQLFDIGFGMHAKPDSIARIIGMSRMKIVSILAGQLKDMTIEVVAAQAVQDLNSDCGTAVDNPWIQHLKAEPAATSAIVTEVISESMIEYGDDGQTWDNPLKKLLEKGFKKDTMIRNKSSGECATLSMVFSSLCLNMI